MKYFINVGLERASVNDWLIKIYVSYQLVTPQLTVTLTTSHDTTQHNITIQPATDSSSSSTCSSSATNLHQWTLSCHGDWRQIHPTTPDAQCTWVSTDCQSRETVETGLEQWTVVSRCHWLIDRRPSWYDLHPPVLRNLQSTIHYSYWAGSGTNVYSTRSLQTTITSHRLWQLSGRRLCKTVHSDQWYSHIKAPLHSLNQHLVVWALNSLYFVRELSWSL